MLTRQVSHIIVHLQLNIFPAFHHVVPMSNGAQVEPPLTHLWSIWFF